MPCIRHITCFAGEIYLDQSLHWLLGTWGGLGSASGPAERGRFKLEGTGRSSKT
jgi:hypothetical protein